MPKKGGGGGAGKGAPPQKTPWMPPAAAAAPKGNPWTPVTARAPEFMTGGLSGPGAAIPHPWSAAPDLLRRAMGDKSPPYSGLSTDPMWDKWLGASPEFRDQMLQNPGQYASGFPFLPTLAEQIGAGMEVPTLSRFVPREGGEMRYQWDPFGSLGEFTSRITNRPGLGEFLFGNRVHTPVGSPDDYRLLTAPVPVGRYGSNENMVFGGQTEIPTDPLLDQDWIRQWYLNNAPTPWMTIR